MPTVFIVMLLVILVQFSFILIFLKLGSQLAYLSKPPPKRQSSAKLLIFGTNVVLLETILIIFIKRWSIMFLKNKINKNKKEEEEGGVSFIVLLVYSVSIEV